MRRAPVIVIDGPAACGKSTAARNLARRLGLRFLDSGAMYRALTWKALQTGAELTDERAVAAVADAMHVELDSSPDAPSVSVDGVDVTEAIRTPELTVKVRHVARLPEARQRVVSWQRRVARGGGIVAEGRDMGTVVFPDADVKFYLDASVEERARRRWEELRARGRHVDPQALRQEIAERDRTDLERDVAPLRRAEDAIYVDNTGLSPEETLSILAAEVEARARWRAGGG